MRSAADIDEVGCPELVTLLARIESTRNCWPSSCTTAKGASRETQASKMPRSPFVTGTIACTCSARLPRRLASFPWLRLRSAMTLSGTSDPDVAEPDSFTCPIERPRTSASGVPVSRVFPGVDVVFGRARMQFYRDRSAHELGLTAKECNDHLRRASSSELRR